MSLPLSLSSLSTANAAPVGPFQSSAGNYYVIGPDSTSPWLLRVLKATDPSSSFSSVNTNNPSTITTSSGNVVTMDAYQVGDAIHIVTCPAGAGATNGGTVRYCYSKFDMSSDTWTVTSEYIVGTSSTLNSAADNSGTGTISGTGVQVDNCSIAVRSTGEVVVFYNGVHAAVMSVNYARVYYSRRTGTNTWATQVAVDAGGSTSYVACTAAVGTSDSIHFLFQGGSTTYVRTLSSANVLQTVATGANLGPADVVAYGATPKLVSVGSGGTAGPDLIGSLAFSSATTPTLTAATLASTTGTGAVSSNISPARVFVDGTTVYCIWAAADGDVYVSSSTDDGTSWGSPTSSLVGTVAANYEVLSKGASVYQRASNYVIPYVANDNGTWKYNEYTVRSTGISGTASPTEAADTLGGPTSVAVRGISSIPYGVHGTASSLTNPSQTKDLLLFFGILYDSSGGSAEFTPPDGSWASLPSTPGRTTILSGPYARFDVFYKFADGSEGASITFGNSGFPNGAILYAISGSDKTAPFTPSPVNVKAADPAISGVSAARDNSLAIYSVVSNSALTGKSATDGFSTRDIETVIAAYDKIVSSGAIGTVTLSPTGTDPETEAQLVVVQSSLSDGPATGNVAASNPVGTLAVVETADTASVSGAVSIDGSLAKFETADTMSGTGTAVQPTGTVGALEAADTGSGAGAVLISGGGTSVEALDTASGSGAVLVSGSTATLEAHDTGGGTGAVAINGTIAQTEAADTTAEAGEVSVDGPISATEAADTSVATGSVDSSPVTGTLGALEAADTAFATGEVLVAGDVAIVEQGDTGAVSGAVSVNGAATAIEQGDSGTGAGTVAIDGSSSPTEAADTSAGTADVQIAGSLAITEAADALSATGEPIVAGSVAYAEFADTTAAAGTVLVEGSVAYTEFADSPSAFGGVADDGFLNVSEAGDTSVAAGDVPDIGSIAANDNADTMAADGGVSIDGTVAVTEAADTCFASSSATAIGSAAAVETADTSAASGSVLVSGSSSVIEAADTSSATGVLVVTGALVRTEQSDTGSASGSISIDGAAAISERADSVTSAGQVSVSGAAACAEAGDSASASGNVTTPAVGSLDVTENADTPIVTGRVTVSGSANYTEQPDTISGTASVIINGTFSKLEQSDTAAGSGEVAIEGFVDIYGLADTSAGVGYVLIEGGVAVTEVADSLEALANVFTPYHANLKMAKRVTGSPSNTPAGGRAESVTVDGGANKQTIVGSNSRKRIIGSW